MFDMQLSAKLDASEGRRASVRGIVAARSAAIGPAAAVLCVVLLGALGCGGGRIYKATKLPAEFLAPRTENALTVDLSRLATYSVSSEYIDRGDVLEVTIDTGYGTERANTYPARVADDGSASIPLVGKVQVAGLEMEAAEQSIAAAGVSRGVFRSPNVTVVMKRQRSNKVTVIGAVDKPGVYELPRGSSALLAGIVAAGGLAKDAGTEVEIRRPAKRGQALPALGPNQQARGGAPGAQVNFNQAPPESPAPTSYKVDLVKAAQEGNGGYYLEDGDVVMVQKRDFMPVHVIGLVAKPGEFELPTNKDLHVLDVIALAGGTNSQLANKIHVIRHVGGKEEPTVIEVSLREAKLEGKGNLRLAAGDVVSVEQTPATIIYGAINNFVRFGISGSVPLY